MKQVFFTEMLGAAHLFGTLVDLQRLEGPDRPIQHNHHIYAYSDANPHGWFFGDRGRWIARGGGQPDSTAYYQYVLWFEDGTRGICQVRRVTEALAALGYELDRDPPI